MTSQCRLNLVVNERDILIAEQFGPMNRSVGPAWRIWSGAAAARTRMKGTEMTRNLKAAGLALAAAFVISAVAASAATAQTYGFTGSEVEGTSIQRSHDEEAEDRWWWPFGTWKCNTHLFEHHTTSYSETTTSRATSSYGDCSGSGLAVTVNTEGCEYVFHVTSESAASMDIACEEGKQIELTTLACTVKVGSQEGLGSIGLENVGGGSEEEIAMTFELAGIAYTYSGFLCGSGSGEDAEYTGEARTHATNEAEEQVPSMVGEI